MGILYLSTKFEFDRTTNNGNLLSDRNYWKHRQTDRQTDTQTDGQTHRRTHRLNLKLSLYMDIEKKESKNKGEKERKKERKKEAALQFFKLRRLNIIDSYDNHTKYPNKWLMINTLSKIKKTNISISISLET